MPRLKLYQVSAPAAGINKRYPATMLPDEATPKAQNVRFRGGVLFKRLGYTTLTDTSVSFGVASGVTSGPMLARDFQQLSGTTTALLATTYGIYKWTGSAFTEIKNSLNGSMAGYHSACTMNDTWFYTNGVDAVQKWTGTGSASNLTGGDDYQTPTYHICRAIATYADRLILLGPNEDGTSYPYRVRWSELGKIDEWSEAEGGGYSDAIDDPTGIQGSELLGNWLIVYCGQSIWQMTYVGGTVHYTFNRIVPNTGTSAPRTIMDTGNVHIFMGDDDIYAFDGMGITPIGEPIRDELFKGVAPANRIKCFAELNRDETLYRLFVPYGSADGHITRAYIYDYQDNTWTMDSTPRVTCAGALQLGAKMTIDALTGTIDNLQGTIDELGGQEDRKLHVFCDSAGHVYQHDNQTIDDNGTAVDARWDSIDFVLHKEYVDNYKRVQEILFEAKGNTVTVFYSTDHGDTWTSAGTQTLSNGYTRYMLPIDVTARQIRLRFKNAVSNERFWIRWLGVKYYLAAER